MLACPACRSTLATDLRCTACGAAFHSPGGIPRLRVDLDERTDTVRRFYEAAPFPGYPSNDSLERLRARAERSAFARLLDKSIPGDALIAEIGCGTGQMSLYLARADRQIVAVDLSREALRLAAAAARRYGTTHVRFVEGDIAKLPLRDRSFDIVYCSGVLHHMPAPEAGFARVAAAVRPGGFVVIGLYNRFARLPLRLRRAVARLTGFRWVPFDPVLRDREAEPERHEAWLRDQYRHPEEHRHSVAQARRWFDGNRIEYLRCYPSTIGGDEPADLFTPAVDEWGLETIAAQLGWMRKQGSEGGLFMIVGRA